MEAARVLKVILYELFRSQPNMEKELGISQSYFSEAFRGNASRIATILAKLEQKGVMKRNTFLAVVKIVSDVKKEAEIKNELVLKTLRESNEQMSKSTEAIIRLSKRISA